jgi:hypothetical protein
MIMAGLREIAAAGDAKLHRQCLEHNGHEVGKHDDAEKGEVVFRSAGEVGRPIPRVHVANRHEKTRPGKGEQFAEKTSRGRNNKAAMNLGKTWPRRLRTPTGLRMEGVGISGISHG